ncbi:hypothetical protein GH714_023858 [Hevea brasiliensis]|uniref:DUF1517 domain-containing protein n=1 Tax=Hevea brasiliensis TaxID=3981 RepID=A0A6A6LDG7_HEVBR|nr:hypothetical protein GH714_023858 [Hevea brasiliensis]
MGGKSFSRSSSSSSRSYSVPRTSSRGFSYSVPYYAPSPFGGGGGIYVGPAVGVGVGAGSSLFLILAGFAAFMLVSGFLSDRSEGGVLTATAKTSVLKLQVGLLGMGRSLQRDLNRIAEIADTSSSEEASLALLRHPDYCISGYSYITILVAAEGVHKLPTINGSGDLKEALQKLGSIPTSKILAVEVLWTPQNEHDTLTERELLEDYPLLRPL